MIVLLRLEDRIYDRIHSIVPIVPKEASATI